MTGATALDGLVRIIDDFLPEEALARLEGSVRGLHVYPPQPDEYPGLVWRLGDVPPCVSAETYDTRHPAPGSPFEPLIDCLTGLNLNFESLGLRVEACSARLQVMRYGQCLSVHYDGNDGLSGGYTFYLSDTWDPHWGGILIAFDPATFSPQKDFTLLDAGAERSRLCATAVNYAVVPRRNRLVMLRNPVRHMVTPVLQGAGDRVRMACTGYFRAATCPG